MELSEIVHPGQTWKWQTQDGKVVKYRIERIYDSEVHNEKMVEFTCVDSSELTEQQQEIFVENALTENYPLKNFSHHSLKFNNEALGHNYGWLGPVEPYLMPPPKDDEGPEVIEI